MQAGLTSSALTSAPKLALGAVVTKRGGKLSNQAGSVLRNDANEMGICGKCCSPYLSTGAHRASGLAQREFGAGEQSGTCLQAGRNRRSQGVDNLRCKSVNWRHARS